VPTPSIRTALYQRDSAGSLPISIHLLGDL
jgi:hypothetical protein